MLCWWQYWLLSQWGCVPNYRGLDKPCQNKFHQSFHDDRHWPQAQPYSELNAQATLFLPACDGLNLWPISTQTPPHWNGLSQEVHSSNFLNTLQLLQVFYIESANWLQSIFKGFSTNRTVPRLETSGLTALLRYHFSFWNCRHFMSQNLSQVNKCEDQSNMLWYTDQCHMIELDDCNLFKWQSKQNNHYFWDLFRWAEQTWEPPFPSLCKSGEITRWLGMTLLIKEITFYRKQDIMFPKFNKLWLKDNSNILLA